VGVSSHNYDFYLSGTNQPILIFEFNNINLPDSASNPTGSQGFIKFKIAPNSNTPLGTVIENKAAIYFDFNEPIITNTAWITIDEIPLGPPLIISIVSGTENSSEVNDVKIFPNPTDNFVNVQVSNKSEFSTLNVYDLNGRLVKQKQLVDDLSIISLEDLPAGIYTMQILNDKKIKIFKIVKNK
jgi:hypothetical protein